MKHSEKKTTSLLFLIIYTALGLIVPNVWLDITELYITAIGKVINILFPLAAYIFFITLFRRQGWGVICCIPFMIFAAFQIVLLFLYGESIIAVDMFLNVVTTDFEEATTLLENLMSAILLVVILYLPAIVWAIISVSKRQILAHYPRLVVLTVSGLVTIGFGIILLVTSLLGSVTPGTDIFPVNVIQNVCLAVKRDKIMREYPESAKNFSYEASDTDSTRRVLALVIGETARPDRWQLFGAERPTTPQLSQRSGIVTFDRAISQSNTTHKSVPMLLTPLSAETFDRLNGFKSIIDAFKEAGFQTSWLSNQPPNGAYNEHIGYEADTTLFFKYVSDVDLVHEAETLLDSLDPERNQLLVLHTYGGHFPYNQRYEGREPVFTPDAPMQANPSNKDALLNAYDNATVITDMALDSLINVLGRFNENAVMIYAADHGEDIYDDSREKFLHASPSPTYYQLRVPMFIWISENMENRHDFIETARQYRYVPMSPAQTLFHTAIEAGGINTKYYDSKRSLLSTDFQSEPLMYLTDRNKAVPLSKSGIRSQDIEQFAKIGVEIQQ